MRSGPPIDEELRAYLPAEERLTPFMEGEAGIANLREAMVAAYEDVQAVRAGTGAVIREEVVEGVPLIIIEPPKVSAPRGAILNIHGGGLVAGGSRSALESNARIALALGCVMVIPDYRLAPEHPYPVPLDDVTVAWAHLLSGGVGDSVDRDHLVLMGGSSGGGLAAGLTIRLRERGARLPCALVLLQPQLDDRNTQPSTYELENEAFWDRTSNITGWNAYLGDADDVPSEAAPAREPDLTGFPSTFIEIAQVDLFRDEALDFAARLSRDGVPVELHLWAGAFHGFDGLVATRVAQRAVAARLDFLSGVFSSVSHMEVDVEAQ